MRTFKGLLAFVVVGIQALIGNAAVNIQAPQELGVSDTGQLDTRGCATLFAFEPVPEPGVTALILVGVVVAYFVGRKGFLCKGKRYGAH